MPIMIYLRNPGISLVINSELTRELVKKIVKRSKGLVIDGKTMEGDPLVIFQETQSNIVYMKQISVEQHEEMKKEFQEQLKKTAADKGGRIEQVQNVIKHPFRKRGDPH